MKDIVAELRQCAAAIERQGETNWIYDDAADEIERQRDEVARLRLTDAEREAIGRLCEAANDMIADDKRAGGVHWQEDAAAVAVVRGLLERLG